MEATLQGQDINVPIRTNKLADGHFKSWSDSPADDYIHWPQSAAFEVMSFFELTRHYKKVFKPLQGTVKKTSNLVIHIQDISLVI